MSIQKYLESIGIKRLKKWRHTSPSQISTFRQCKRKWWLEKIAGIKQPSTPAQKRGTEKHAHLEAYLKGGAPLTDKVCAAGHHFLPHPDSVEPGDVEQKFLFRHKDMPVPVKGVVDLVEPAIPRISDHKTTADFKYAKTPEELEGDAQAVLYTCHAARDVFKDEEMDLPFRLIYYRTRGAPASRVVEVLMTRERRESGLKAIVETSHKMAACAEEEDPREVHGNANRCGDYGGCPHRMLCARMGTSTMGALTGLLRPPTEEGMGGFQKAMERAKKRAEEATAAAAGTPVPEVAPEPVDIVGKREAQAAKARETAESDQGGVVPPDAPPATTNEAPDTTKAAPAAAPLEDNSGKFPFGVPPMDDGEFLESMRQGGHTSAKKPELVKMVQRACHLSGKDFPDEKLKKPALTALLLSCLGSSSEGVQTGTEGKSAGSGEAASQDSDSALPSSTLTTTPPEKEEDFLDWIFARGFNQPGVKRQALVDVVMIIDAKRPDGAPILCADPDEEDRESLIALLEGYAAALPEKAAPEPKPESVETKTACIADVLQGREWDNGDTPRKRLVALVRAVEEDSGKVCSIDVDEAEKGDLREVLRSSADCYDEQVKEKEKKDKEEAEKAEKAEKAKKALASANVTPEKVAALEAEAQRLFDEKEAMIARGMGSELYVNCIPRRTAPDAPEIVYMDFWLLPFQEVVADDAQLPHYALLEFNDGPKRVAALIRQGLREGSLELPLRMFANRYAPCSDLVLETIMDRYDRVFEKIS